MYMDGNIGKVYILCDRETLNIFIINLSKIFHLTKYNDENKIVV